MRLLVSTGAVIVIAVLFVQCKNEKKSEPLPDSMEEEAREIPVLEAGSLNAIDEAFWELIPRDAKLEILAEGHDWTEGPLWVEESKMLLYTDIPKNAVYRWKEGEGAKPYLQPSGFLGEDFKGKEPGANGLLLDQNGSLVLCQHGERRMARMKSPLTDPSPEYESLASHYDGKRFNSPNDAVYMSNGDLYFTDPPYGLPGQMEDPGKELPYQGVYRLDTNGEVTLLTKEFSRPNGIAFSPDERKLYVANSDPEKAIWKSFDLNADGLLENGRVLHDATEDVPGNQGLPDGLKVDKAGNIYATGPGGVLVFSADGKLLGRIHTGQANSNCALNKDGSELYITADSYLLRVRLK
jgi:gluconolactonase